MYSSRRLWERTAWIIEQSKWFYPIKTLPNARLEATENGSELGFWTDLWELLRSSSFHYGVLVLSQSRQDEALTVLGVIHLLYEGWRLYEAVSRSSYWMCHTFYFYEDALRAIWMRIGPIHWIAAANRWKLQCFCFSAIPAVIPLLRAGERPLSPGPIPNQESWIVPHKRQPAPLPTALPLPVFVHNAFNYNASTTRRM